ncbi:hypothetical protein FA15DRAFT_283157 [Coprinopsis marcescibilis]|uniref:Uncharacterized protein n=1 Tax=Coprinopsis marcescibilis TaxID=230819 RepID=A0A5C3LCE3_COPMA|nr:hypothetical protein FA15DRAFT_283157 [Coprinopsis marcescibilis]
MGRSLFSKTHPPAPAVRTEPERIADPCQKWSDWNKFDPDSEEFFSNAQLELFIDAEAVRQSEQEMREEVRRTVLDAASDSGSDTSDSSASDVESPVPQPTTVVPIRVVTSTFPVPREQTSRYDITVSPQVQTTHRMPIRELPTVSPRSYRQANRSAVSAAISPSVVRGALALNEASPEQVPTPPLSPVFARALPAPTVHYRAPSVPRSRTPSPTRAPVVPSTPPALVPMPALVTPSPPGSVTPRSFYSWQTHSIPAVPTSPTFMRGNRDGPLTNPRARMSFAQLSNAQSAVLVQNVN